MNKCNTEVAEALKPISKTFGYAGEVPYTKFMCPTGCCKIAIHRERDNYCPNCGVKIDWSVEDSVASDTSKWIPFKSEYDEYYKMEILQDKIPEEDEEILVTDGKNVWSDTFIRNGIECYLDGGNALVSDVIAWQPFPEPYRL